MEYLQVTVKVNRVPLRLQWAQESLEYLVKIYVLRFCISHRLPCDGIGSLGGIGILSSKSLLDILKELVEQLIEDHRIILTYKEIGKQV